MLIFEDSKLERKAIFMNSKWLLEAFLATAQIRMEIVSSALASPCTSCSLYSASSPTRLTVVV